MEASAAAATDNAGPGVHGQIGVAGHEFRGAVVVDMLAHELWNARIRLGDEGNACRLRGHAKHAHHEVRGANAAVGAECHGRRRQLFREFDQGGGRDTHHRAARGIEAGRESIGNAYSGGCGCCGLNLFQRGHGFNPRHVRAAVLEALHLLRKHGDGQVFGQFA